MKPSIHETSSSSGSMRRSLPGNAENRKWRVGTRVERELDGTWFPATVVDCDDDGGFEIEYDEDQNRETEITEDELRLLRDHDDGEDTGGEPQTATRPQTAGARPQTAGNKTTETQLRDSILLQPSDYDPNKTPTVVLHHRGESHAAASAYIINGLENNIAAGNGLRGIRWLRVNTL